MIFVTTIFEELLAWNIHQGNIGRSSKNMFHQSQSYQLDKWDNIFVPPLRTHTFHDTKIVNGHVALPDNLKLLNHQ